MAVKLNLWSLTLLPGEKYPMMIPRDFQITNAALGEELREADGRSVVKVTHNPIPPSAFDSDSEDDSELDSDLEDDEDEELDEDEEAEMEAILKAEAAGKGKKANGVKKEEKIKVEAEDEEEDSEDDEDFEGSSLDSDDIDLDTYETNVICSLTAGKIEQCLLNLTFVEGDLVIFETSGENSVHLMGNYIDQYPADDSESEFDSEYDDYSDLIGSDDDEDDELDATIEEIDEPATLKPKKTIAAALSAEKPKKAAAAVAPAKTETKTEVKPKVKATEATPAAATATATKRKAEDAGDVSMTSTDGLSKNQKKKLAKKAKTEDAPASAPVAAKAAAGPQKKTLPSGLIIEDIKTGEGPVAKPGKRLSMRYIGKLENGKQFDANTAGKPFSFMLGRGEVIKGWDQGLVGMAVGGERRLTIPAALAYGSQKIPGIPKNSTLKFDVKLVSIN